MPLSSGSCVVLKQITKRCFHPFVQTEIGVLLDMYKKTVINAIFINFAHNVLEIGRGR